MNSIAFLLRKATGLLDSSDNPQLEAELLLAHILAKPRSYLYAWPEYELSETECGNFISLIQARVDGQPIAYLLENREFWSLSLRVSPAVLIPRPETELLVETSLELIPSKQAIAADLGTGSGAIALALASERPNWEIYATDRSHQALEVAQSNANRLILPSVQFRQGSWCEALPTQLFDIIVSNPPYIEATDPHLKQGDLRFEPQSALIATNCGLADIECIADQARDYLKPGAYLLLEHGYDQAAKVADILRQYGYSAIQTRKDLSGIERLSFAQYSAL